MRTKLNKKGTIDDFGDLIVGGIIITILVVVLIILIAGSDDQKKIQTDVDLKLQETAKTTRLMLDQETPDGKKIYEVIIEQEATRNYKPVGVELNRTLDKLYGASKGNWLLIIKDPTIEYWEYIKSDPDVAVPQGLTMLPSVSIPDGKGQIINVTIKKLEKSDDILLNLLWRNPGSSYAGPKI